MLTLFTLQAMPGHDLGALLCVYLSNALWFYAHAVLLIGDDAVAQY